MVGTQRKAALDHELDALSKRLWEINGQLYATKMKKANRLKAKLQAFEASNPGIEPLDWKEATKPRPRPRKRNLKRMQCATKAASLLSPPR